MGKQKAFLLYHDNREIINRLDDKQAGQLFKAIFEYEVDGNIKQGLDPVSDMALHIFKINLDKARADYEKKCKDKSEAGRKGGLARASRAKQNQATEQNNNNNININKNKWAV